MPASLMLERAVQAARREYFMITNELTEKMVRAVIRSLREPSPKGLEIMCGAHPPEGYSPDTPLSKIVLAEHRALIDHVLGDDP